jgi:hypothetical protein
VLSVDTHFYEFIKDEDMEKKNPKVYTADKLEKGNKYVILFTNSAGLYRYNTNDIVLVTDYFNKAPCIEFLHRGEHTSSITGEKLTEWHISHAIKNSAVRYNIPVNMFTASVQWGNPPHYLILIESGRDIKKEKEIEFIKSVDKDLKKLNFEYKEKRDSGRLGHPVLNIIEQKSYEKYHRKRVEEGAHDSQVKIPVFTKDKKFLSFFKIKDRIAIPEIAIILLFSLGISIFTHMPSGITGAAIVDITETTSIFGIFFSTIIYSIGLIAAVILVQHFISKK